MSNQASGELVIIPDDMPFQASPLNTPYRTTTMVESESVQVEDNSSSLWLSPNFIFDSSTVIPESFCVSLNYISMCVEELNQIQPVFVTCRVESPSKIYTDTTSPPLSIERLFQ